LDVSDKACASQSERTGAATLYANIALTYVNAHFYEDAARYARRTIELAQSLPSSQGIASKGLSRLANALRYQGHLDAALSVIRRARELSEQAAYPSETARLINLYGILLREGRILGEEDTVNLGRPAEAIQVLQKALDMMEAASRKDERDSASRGRVATIARELGDILRDRDPQRALAVYNLGIRRLDEIRGNSLKARRDRAQLLASSSYALRHLHRTDESKARIDTAVAILKSTHDYPAERIRLGSHSHVIACALADHDAASGSSRHAIEEYDELLRKVLASGPKPETILGDAVGISRIYTVSAGLNRRAGRQERASALEARERELWQHWDARLPNNSFIHHQLRAAIAAHLGDRDINK
jgi:tetratricopeptide (TPR) repeat protein